MGLIKTLIFLTITLGSSYILYLLLKPASIPKVEDEYWGPSSKKGEPEDKSIRDFKIEVPEAVLTDLKNRLKTEINGKRFTPPLEGIGFEYGFNTKFLQTVLYFWAEKYNWRTREQLLNAYPHFQTKIGGLDIHFQHVKTQKTKRLYKKTLPLLLLHGWPGSFVEFQKIIPMLTDPRLSDYNFELIIPSLPGYGFSEGAHRPGLNAVAMANIFVRLMKRLGHEQFYTMGGDWGGLIISDMSTLYPNNVLGSHSSICSNTHPIHMLRTMLVALFPSTFGEKEVTDKMFPLSKMYSYLIRESGYLHLQATKPDTIGVPLSQSPSGIAVYILEKFSTWTNKTWIDREDGGLLKKFTMDELLDNVMIYWVTNSITTSMRLYSETLSATSKNHVDWVPTSVPFACVMQLEDLALQSEFVLQDKYKRLEQYTLAPHGHFGAFEAPKFMAEDFLKFINALLKE